MIDFMTEGVEMPLLDFANIDRWLHAVAEDYNRRIGNLTYQFCSDEFILGQNRKFLGHDYFTDIITFDYSRGDRVSGDIILSLETVASNALELGVPYDTELRRVIVHGLLHLCGINDKGPGEREIMEAAEDRALALYNQMA